MTASPTISATLARPPYRRAYQPPAVIAIIAIEVAWKLSTGRGGDPLADHPGRSARSHGHSVQAISRFHGPLLMADDQQLRLISKLVDEIQEPVQVHIIESRFHLVEHVERRRA